MIWKFSLGELIRSELEIVVLSSTVISLCMKTSKKYKENKLIGEFVISGGEITISRIQFVVILLSSIQEKCASITLMTAFRVLIENAELEFGRNADTFLRSSTTLGTYVRMWDLIPTSSL